MFIRSDTDYEAVEEPFDTKTLTWYTVKANLTETKQEIDERIQATKEQIRRGIIQPNGLPTGINPAMVGAPSQKQSQLPRKLPLLPKQLTPQQQWNQRFGIRR